MSPVKTAKSGKPYFRAEVQGAEKVENVVCFSPSKRRLFNELSFEGKGCIINNVKSAKDCIYVNDYSTVQEKELGFVQNPSVDYLNISQVLNEVPLDNKVHVRGVAVLEEARTVMSNGEEIHIREGFLVDENQKIPLTLWREYCALIDSRTTYNFKNLVKMKYASEIRLQTSHNTSYEISAEQIENYAEIPIILDIDMDAVQFVSIECGGYHCIECKKPVAEDTKEDLVIKCTNCNKVMLIKSLKRKKIHAVFVGEGAERLKLYVHEELLQLCFPDKLIGEMEEKQLAILLLNNRFDISYKESSMNITSIHCHVF